MAEVAHVSHPKVTNNTGQVEKVVDSTIASTTTLEAGTTTLMVTQMRRVEDGGQKTLAERIHEAYGDELEPEEKELLDRAAEQFGRRLSNEE